ncbi:hypothetical protein FGLOB1_1540 [Fusarium globosum]|uniref:Uncharacterized protein n=1 Tax=Fusarium globosum TaxID=78864 RepID=A0A8H6DI36_9HYPO|nr:hypothetical protein FGLOB1_1540 [Fusarium globosum]
MGDVNLLHVEELSDSQVMKRITTISDTNKSSIVEALPNSISSSEIVDLLISNSYVLSNIMRQSPEV